MKTITFYLDFISPYAYLAFEKLPQTLEGISHQVVYKPVLLGALLRHHGQLGPAEIVGKREWTYRQVLWLAREEGIPLQMPRQHPFAPLPLLRLAVACGQAGLPNRWVCETVFHHVWRGAGADPNEPGRLAQLRAQLQPARSPDEESVKADLRAHTEAAAAQRVFGVPLFEVDGEHFWGLDALPLLRAYLQGDPWFSGPWREASQVLMSLDGAPAGRE